jgi:hypothetical protein
MPQPTTCFTAWISFNTFPLLMQVEDYVNRTAVPYMAVQYMLKLHLLNHEQCTQSSQFSRLWQFFYMKKPIELWQNLSNPSLSFLGQDTEYIPLYICHLSELTPLPISKTFSPFLLLICRQVCRVFHFTLFLHIFSYYAFFSSARSHS